MGKVVFDITMSLDGYYAAPNDSVENPLGVGGMGLHDWVFNAKTDQDEQILTEMVETVGALIAGRRTYDISVGTADGWGEESGPLGSVPTFVVSHSVPKRVAKVFTFVTEGVESALSQAKATAGDKNVHVMSAGIAQQLLAAGLIDELRLHVAPVLLGEGRRLFEHIGTEPIKLERTKVVETPGATHLRFHVVK